jgi:hypothetical protein
MAAHRQSVNADSDPNQPRYFFSRSSVASLRNIGRRRFAAFARSQGNDTSMRSASSSTSMLAAAVWPRARMRKRNVSPSQVSCSIAISPRLPLVRAKPFLRRRTASTFPRRWPTMAVTVSLTESVTALLDVHAHYYDRTAIAAARIVRLWAGCRRSTKATSHAIYLNGDRRFPTPKRPVFIRHALAAASSNFASPGQAATVQRERPQD